MMNPISAVREEARVSPATGDSQVGGRVNIAKDALDTTAMTLATSQTPGASAKEVSVGGNVIEKVGRGALARFCEGISPLPSSLKSGMEEGFALNVEAILNEDEVNDDDQECGELETIVIKRRSLLRDKALAEKELEYLEEAQQQHLEKIRKAKGKAPIEDTGGPPRAPFIPRQVQSQGGRFQGRGGRGSRSMARPRSRDAVRKAPIRQTTEVIQDAPLVKESSEPALAKLSQGPVGEDNSSTSGGVEILNASPIPKKIASPKTKPPDRKQGSSSSKRKKKRDPRIADVRWGGVAQCTL
ncbi:hypothetical protein U1Q18_037836 [Sarracenia purpurea var. burkii]